MNPTFQKASRANKLGNLKARFSKLYQFKAKRKQYFLLWIERIAENRYK